MYFYAHGGYGPISIAGRFQVFVLQKTESLAGFGQATIDVFENTKLTAGLRYTSDWQSVHWTMVTDPALTLLTDQRAKQNNQKLTWRLVVAQELTPDINLYASYNRGTHSGGFSIGGPGTPPYKPEVLDRSEEHTSELQSLMRISYAVFCLKKKTQ